MKLKVKSFTGEKSLDKEYIFDPPHKKYGELKYFEKLAFGGGSFSAKILSEKGVEILDQEIWQSVEVAISEYKKENPPNDTKLSRLPLDDKRKRKKNP